MMVTIKLHEF